jgi:hypothetical protein
MIFYTLIAAQRVSSRLTMGEQHTKLPVMNQETQTADEQKPM